MVHAEPFGEQAMVRGDHVIVVVLRKMRVQAVAGLRRFSVADTIWKNDVIARRVEKLSRAEELAGKNGCEELMAGATGAVKNQNRVGDAALRIARGLAQGCVVQPKLWQRFAGAKLEILDHKFALGRGGSRGGVLCGGGPSAEENKRDRANEET